MRKPLWMPSEEHVEQANVTQFMKFANRTHNLEISSYDILYKWSIRDISKFWEVMWQFAEVQASREFDKVVDNLNKFHGAKWFVGAKMNFAENLLRYRDEHIAFISKGETDKPTKMTYAELYDRVTRLAEALRRVGVVSGDRIAAYMPNITETSIGMLAATSIGAIWSSCGTELGPSAVVDRLSQIEPKVLFTVAGYPYKGKVFKVLDRIGRIVDGVPSLQKIVIIPYKIKEFSINGIPKSVLYNDFDSGYKPSKFKFEQLPSDHPVYIMFSSGTTGNPKCMVQSASGILVNHLKELLLHTDLRREDRIFYISTPSWMMWNWLLSSLAVGATVILYDGNPLYPDWHTLWKFVEDVKMTIFGCSATYLNYLRGVGAKPEKEFDLSSLREISQTGSPLSAEGFEYVYQEIKEDLHLNSISGGTDINGCFAAGTPIQPVYVGELQSPALGMKVKAYNAQGMSVLDQEGELVCEMPSPSMPIYFWNDPDGEKYRKAYFDYYPNVWRHGDWILIHSDTGGITFLGRSDFTLKPSGVRIGPAEIYNVVDKFQEVTDSLVVGQDWKADQRIILFVKLAEGFQLTEDLKNRLKRSLRTEASPRHVPTLIIKAPDIPYTYNMKKVESAVANIINGEPVTNRDALINPETLGFYEEILPKLRKE
ncbi:MAG: acetoacetate--CoA ligase [Candidatus Bathyarchaeota archaeon]|jgi:acetoacetyl-CoA synthetase